MGDHDLDSQAEAFRGAEAADFVSDEDIAASVASGDLIVSTDAPLVPIEVYEDQGWDEGRTGPKSLEEAKAALAARVEDPSAPDNDASVYDSDEHL